MKATTRLTAVALAAALLALPATPATAPASTRASSHATISYAYAVVPRLRLPPLPSASHVRVLARERGVPGVLRQRAIYLRELRRARSYYKRVTWACRAFRILSGQPQSGYDYYYQWERDWDSFCDRFGR